MPGSGWFKTNFEGGHTRLVSGLDKGVEKQNEIKGDSLSFSLRTQWLFIEVRLGKCNTAWEEIQETYFGFGESDTLIGRSGRDAGEGTDS